DPAARSTPTRCAPRGARSAMSGAGTARMAGRRCVRPGSCREHLVRALPRAQCESLEDVVELDRLALGEVRNRARHAQHAVVAARAESAGVVRLRERAPRRAAEADMG